LLWQAGARLTPFDPLSNPSLAALFFTFLILALWVVSVHSTLPFAV
jgi:hypothetical protein